MGERQRRSRKGSTFIIFAIIRGQLNRSIWCESSGMTDVDQGRRDWLFKCSIQWRFSLRGRGWRIHRTFVSLVPPNVLCRLDANYVIVFWQRPSTKMLLVCYVTIETTPEWEHQPEPCRAPTPTLSLAFRLSLTFRRCGYLHRLM